MMTERFPAQQERIIEVLLQDGLNYGRCNTDMVDEYLDIQDALMTLPERDRQVVCTYAEGYTFEEIGRMHNLSKQYISVIYLKSMEKLVEYCII